MSNQSQYIRLYNDAHREKFNEQLFVRDDSEIIDCLKKVIVSCERDRFFTIKVLSFTVIDNYDEINKILYEYEEAKNKNRNKKRVNMYEFINLRDSDIKLLIVKYFIRVGDNTDTFDVIIALPRIVNKYYFRISGNIYSSMYQIVDGSTYNNSTSNSRKQSVTLKNMSMPIRIYRSNTAIKTTKKESIKCTFYVSRIFNKSLPVFKYIFAKFGLYGTLEFLGIHGITFTTYDIDDHTMYTFQKNDNLYISVPKMLYQDSMVQALINTLLRAIHKDHNINDIAQDNYWLRSLGAEFNNETEQVGLSKLDSLENIYDIPTREIIRLPEEEKATVYHIIRWMVREFTNLRIKDNLDISTKRIRCAEYIASLYAMKISKGLYRISDDKEVQIESIKKSICTVPMYLLTAISKSKLINYRNMVNDNDAITVLKCTYKGISGIGDQKGNTISDIYRTTHPSQLNRVDLDSSSNTDPGITGTICPLTRLYDGSFSDYQEPNMWESEFNKLMNDYKALVGLKEVITFKKEITGEYDEQRYQIISDSLDTMKKLIEPISFIENTSIIEVPYQEISLEDSDTIVYGSE